MCFTQENPAMKDSLIWNLPKPVASIASSIEYVSEIESLLYWDSHV